MNRYKRAVLILLILAVVFLVFYPSLRNGFTWDDSKYIIGNNLIRDLSRASTKRIFGSFFFCNYHPLTLLSYSLDYYFSGLDPFGYRLTNLTLHLLNSLLVFWLIYLLSQNTAVALIVAFFFAIHPLQVEPAVWVSSRKDVLYSFFFLGAIISYIRSRRERDTELSAAGAGRRGALADPIRQSAFKFGCNRFYYLSLILFVLSLLSKAMAITLPVVLLLIDYLLNRRRDKTMILDKLPFFVLSLIFGIVATFGLYLHGGIRQEGALNLLYKFAVASYSIVFYLGKILIPVKLSCFYPYPDVKQYPLLYLYSSIAVILLLITIIISRRYTRKIIFASSFFLITLIPVLQFVPLAHTIVADRYAYIPSIGIFYAIACGFLWLYARRTKYSRMTRPVLVALLTAIMCILAFLAYKRSLIWKDNLTLWDDVLKNYPDTPIAYNNRGNTYARRGNLDKAVLDYTKAIQVCPDYAQAYNNRGVASFRQGNLDQALSDYTRAIQINPDYALPHHNLVIIYFSKKEYDKSWEGVYRAEALGHRASSAFLEDLKKASGRKK